MARAVRTPKPPPIDLAASSIEIVPLTPDRWSDVTSLFDEMIGIYYWLGRAHQQLGNTREAVEFYDRVFSLDINFADVTERLRALR